MAQTVAVDFDGVLAQYDGWKGEDHLGEPLPGARAFCQRVLDEGYEIAIYSTRNAVRLTEWWEQYHFPTGSGHFPLYGSKPSALVYIDDRAHRFNGDWQAAWDAITQPTWWEQ